MHHTVAKLRRNRKRPFLGINAPGIHICFIVMHSLFTLVLGIIEAKPLPAWFTGQKIMWKKSSDQIVT
jgi:hypothetical protein